MFFMDRPLVKNRKLFGVPYGKSLFNNKFIPAMRIVKNYLKNVHGVRMMGRKQKGLIYQFAHLMGLKVKGDHCEWLFHLYNDNEHHLVRRGDNSFYRTKEWKKLRREVFKEYGKWCMKCGSQYNICVDHIKPRSLFPELEMCFDNMQVLCDMCNLLKSNRHCEDYRGDRKSVPIPKIEALS